MTSEPLRATVSLRGIVLTPARTMLVIRRSSDGIWELPGGRIEARETVHEGLMREFREETGLVPSISEPVHTAAWHNDEGDGRLGVYFHCKGQEQPVELSGEHSEADWIPPHQAMERLNAIEGRAVERAMDASNLLNPELDQIESKADHSSRVSSTSFR